LHLHLDAALLAVAEGSVRVCRPLLVTERCAPESMSTNVALVSWLYFSAFFAW
jgi:hypothetical protein